ncbi:MAG TPA: hypothetical protein VMV77_11025 [Bacteroidales bacterium]|nr:hypothetical protein [Bacteroidales bacterium]
MKKLIITSVLLAIFATCTTILAQDQPEEYMGLPGDNLNLYAVMQLFRESETLEGFEKSLNDENSKINNLDLNGDNFVDYIKIMDYVDGDVHNIVLQVAVNDKENQDLAVFTVQRYANGQVQVQLIGDEELYGKDYIIEPILDEANQGQTPNPGYAGNAGTVNGRNVIITRTTTYEIANWPVVRFIYLPSYRIWRSSWYWGYYPTYWQPWQPYYWHYYYGYHYNWYNNYYGHYRRWNYHRYNRWNDFYYSSRRSHSPNVSVRIKSGNYKATYSHPDQRRNGEAMYTKMHQAQSRRSSNNSPGNNSVRRSGSKSIQDRQSAGTRNNTTRRSTTTVTNNATTNKSSGQNSGTARRSATTVINKSATKPSSGQKTNTARTSKKSTKATGVSSSSRRSSGSSKSGSSAAKNQKAKESKSKKSTRRK